MTTLLVTELYIVIRHRSS